MLYILLYPISNHFSTRTSQDSIRHNKITQGSTTLHFTTGCPRKNVRSSVNQSGERIFLGHPLHQASFYQVKVGPTPFLALHNLWRNLHMFLDILELRVENNNKKKLLFCSRQYLPNPTNKDMSRQLWVLALFWAPQARGWTCTGLSVLACSVMKDTL